MPLMTINDPEAVYAHAEEGPQGLPLIQLPGTNSTRSLLKLGLHGCCEVLGYQLAPRLAVPVMPAIPVWCPHAFDERGQRAGEGRIGLAIQYDKTFEHITWDEAAKTNPKAAAAALLLCTLDRHEWGEFAVTEYGLVFYDLERLFPCWCPERMDGETWDDVACQMRDAADNYRSVISSCSQEVFDEAGRLGLTQALREVAANAATISSDELMCTFNLEPHPLARQIISIAADTAVRQFRLVAQHCSH